MHHIINLIAQSIFYIKFIIPKMRFVCSFIGNSLCRIWVYKQTCKKLMEGKKNSRGRKHRRNSIFFFSFLCCMLLLLIEQFWMHLSNYKLDKLEDCELMEIILPLKNVLQVFILSPLFYLVTIMPLLHKLKPILFNQVFTKLTYDICFGPWQPKLN